jgi:squalene-hopene/tetraprenyl-beta-curcumene cyclase
MKTTLTHRVRFFKSARLAFALCWLGVLFPLKANGPVKPSPAHPTANKPTATPTPKFQYKSAGIEVPAAAADEPKVKVFGADSIRQAQKYLNDGALHWVREKNCIACHSTGVYLVERSVLTPELGKPSEEVLANFVKQIPKPDAKKDVSAVSAVWRNAGLASWDQHVAGKLSESTARSLQLMMTVLTPEGYFATLDEVEIPYITTHFELTVQAARAIVTAPGWLENLKDAETLERIARMKKFLAQHEPVNDYELALKLRLATLMPELVPTAQRDAATAMLWRLQQPDGGWSTRRMSPLLKWHEIIDDETKAMFENEPDAASPGSDAYMTGFAIILLRESGVPTSDARIQKGVEWLKSNQRVSGRWWMKSLYRDTFHYITYISTTQALRALALCGEIPKLVDNRKINQHGSGHGSGPEVKVLSAVDVEEEVNGKKAKATTFEVTFGPGVEGAPHRHPGPIYGYVIEGEFEFAVGDGKVQKLKAGDTFYEPAMALHAVSRNPSNKEKTRVLAVLVHPRDAKELVIPEPAKKEK